MIGKVFLPNSGQVLRVLNCTKLDTISVEMLDETPLACANIAGAKKEKGVFLKIDAAMFNRAVLQLGQTHPCLAARKLIVSGAGA